MGWNKREPVSNLVILGDDEGQVDKVHGLLAALKQDTVYPARHNYELVQQNGDSLMLAGSASLSRQIGPQDVGHFLKATFKGWGKSANGKFKDIEVLVYEGEPTEAMKKWPRFSELCNPEAAAKAVEAAARNPLPPKASEGKAKAKGREADDFGDYPAGLDESDDDSLPF